MRVEPRVAFFPDSFAEVNGVAHTSRQLVAFAERRNLPLLCVHGGGRTERVVEGAVTKLSLRRGSIGFRLEADFRYDLFFWRHANRVIEAAREFKANVVHVTGPNDTGQLGAYVARKLRLPLVISWHTNVHEYAARRLNKLAAPLPDAWRERMASFAERQGLRVALRFCRLGRALLAPNAELRELLTRETGRPTHLMRRGVDTSLFSPVKRVSGDGAFLIGYVGRLSPEKNVPLLIEMIGRLEDDFRLVVAGDGPLAGWLENEVKVRAPGRVRLLGHIGDRAKLIGLYADCDAFVHPNPREPFGIAPLEAMAAGLPLVAPNAGGVISYADETNAWLAEPNGESFAATARAVFNDPATRKDKLARARWTAREYQWRAVTDSFFHLYDELIEQFPSSRFARRNNRPAAFPVPEEYEQPGRLESHASPGAHAGDCRRRGYRSDPGRVDSWAGSRDAS